MVINTLYQESQNKDIPKNVKMTPVQIGCLTNWYSPPVYNSALSLGVGKAVRFLSSWRIDTKTIKLPKTNKIIPGILKKSGNKLQTT